mmetsp:Transcript_12722/g.40739  ORF Transcript_12722/g.40739 Transcript_12722/m.40739 type:complete len:234 (-) Transcript_12722:664-1365(-)
MSTERWTATRARATGTTRRTGSPLAPCGASPSSSRLRACARSGGTTSMRRAPRAAWSRCSTPPRRPVGSCTSSRSAAACRTASLSHPSSARPSQTPPTRRRCSSSFAAGSARVSSSSLPEAAGRPPRPATWCARSRPITGCVPGGCASRRCARSLASRRRRCRLRCESTWHGSRRRRRQRRCRRSTRRCRLVCRCRSRRRRRRRHRRRRRRGVCLPGTRAARCRGAARAWWWP